MTAVYTPYSPSYVPRSPSPDPAVVHSGGGAAKEESEEELHRRVAEKTAREYAAFVARERAKAAGQPVRPKEAPWRPEPQPSAADLQRKREASDALQAARRRAATEAGDGLMLSAEERDSLLRGAEEVRQRRLAREAESTRADVGAGGTRLVESDEARTARQWCEWWERVQWRVMEALRRSQSWVEHQLVSFDWFIRYGLRRVIDARPRVRVHNVQRGAVPPLPADRWRIYTWSISEVAIEYPSVVERDTGSADDLMPRDAELRDLTYSSRVLVTGRLEAHLVNPAYRHSIREGVAVPDEVLGPLAWKRETKKPMELFRLPMMVRSQMCALRYEQEQPVDAEAETHCRECALDPRLRPVHRGECPHDPGGYFIVNGRRIGVLGRKAAAPNVLCVRFRPASDKTYLCEAELYSRPGAAARARNARSSATHCRLLCARASGTPAAAAAAAAEQQQQGGQTPATPVYVELPDLRSTVPLTLLMAVLGATSDREICDALRRQYDGELDCQAPTRRGSDGPSFGVEWSAVLAELRPSLEARKRALSREQALLALGALRERDAVGRLGGGAIESAERYVREEVFPHATMRPGHLGEKLDYAAYALLRLLLLKMGSPAVHDFDRDHPKARLVHLVGRNMESLLQRSYSQYRKELSKKLLRRCLQLSGGGKLSSDTVLSELDLSEWGSARVMTNHFELALKTGRWSQKAEGLSQPLDTTNTLASLSQLRRVQHPSAASSKDGGSKAAAAARQVHTGGYGFLCGIETPEGQRCGLIEYLSQTTMVSTGAADEDQLLTDLRGQTSVCLQTVHTTERGADADTAEVARPHLRRCSYHDEAGGGLPRRAGATCPWTATAARGALPITVLLNGRPVYLCAAEDGPRLAREARAARRAGRWCRSDTDREGDAGREVSITYDREARELHLRSESGRLLRPLLCASTDGSGRETLEQRLRRLFGDGEPPGAAAAAEEAVEWRRLVDEQVVELVGCDETENLAVAMWPHQLLDGRSLGPGGCRMEYTNAELHASAALGLAAAMIPYLQKNPATRSAYQCAMSKQALGVPGLNHNELMRDHRVLDYPQRPLVYCRAAQQSGMDVLSPMQTVVLMIGTQNGWNQEDSLIINQRFLDLGGMRTTDYSLVKCSAQRKRTQGSTVGSYEEFFASPAAVGLDKTPGAAGTARGARPCEYDHLDEDGMPELGYRLRLEGRTPLIGRLCSTIVPGSAGGSVQEQVRNLSVFAPAGRNGVVHRVMCTTDGQGDVHAKVLLRESRVPVIGDKFAERHAQKGTCSRFEPPENMPFCPRTGISPDMIMNAHGQPSRMTMSTLNELLAGHVVCRTGRREDGTGFSQQLYRAYAESEVALRGTAWEGETSDVRRLCDTMHRLGMQATGRVRMCDGYTGRMIPGLQFMGPISYQRLRHQVADKMHSRASGGPHDNVTRQPTAGRKCRGGLRFGEMELNCVEAHGAAAVLQDRMLRNSDAYTVAVCTSCGRAVGNTLNREGFPTQTCAACGGGAETRDVVIPYTTKLLQQELLSMGVAMRLEVDGGRGNPRPSERVATPGSRTLSAPGGGGGGAKKRRTRGRFVSDATLPGGGYWDGPLETAAAPPPPKVRLVQM